MKRHKKPNRYNWGGLTVSILTKDSFENKEIIETNYKKIAKLKTSKIIFLLFERKKYLVKY